MSAAPPIPRAEREGLGILREVEHPGRACGLWLHPWMWDSGGNGAGDPGASCPSGPGHCSRAVGSPENTCRGLSLGFPILLSGIPKLDPGTPEAAAAGHGLGFGIPRWEQPQDLDTRACPTDPVPGMLIPGWLRGTCCSLGCVSSDSCAHPSQGLQSRIPESLTHGNIPSRAWSRGGNTQQCKWGI